MNRSLVVPLNLLPVLLLWMFFSPSEAVGQSVAEKFLKRVYYFGHDSIPYRLFVPENLGPGATYPLVLTLHGSGSIGSDN